MERVFYDHNCKISSILKSINLEHLHCKFIKKCVTLETFLNLTEDDLDYLEITDPRERSIFLNDFKLYKPQFSDILSPREFNHSKMLVTNLHQLNAINSLCSTLLNQVTRVEATQANINRLVDDITPVSKVVTLLNTQMLRSLDLIEHDISEQLNIYEGRKRRSKMWSRGVMIGCLTISIPLVCLLAYNQMKYISPSTQSS